MEPHRILLTGNPGTEDIIAAEALEEIPGSRIVWEKRGYGRVLIEAEGSSLQLLGESLYNMRSIHAGILVLVDDIISKSREGLEQIRSLVLDSGIERLLTYGATFAVRAERAGEGHDYTSMDIARVVGDAVIAASEERLGWRPEVRLNSPAIVVYAEVIEEEFRLGILLTGERSRHRRRYRLYDHPAALKPTLAYSMLRISGAKDGDTILDPMCGGGTIAVEAALLFPGSEVICLDKNPYHIDGARLNARAARVESRIRFIVGDARELDKILGEASVDIVVSNPPYGIRLGDPGGIRRLYRDFLPSLARTLKPGGTATLITTEADYLLSLTKTVTPRLSVSHIRKVRHGDLWASIIKLHRREA